MPRTYYGMPAYAKDGKVICFFQAKSKFKVRYSTSASSPTRGSTTRRCGRSVRRHGLTAANEKRIAELVKKAAG